MAQVFLSHARVDDDLAREVHGWLAEDWHEVFLDCDVHDGLVVGEAWEKRLHERLHSADVVVCLVTSAYRGSVWCTAELVTAQNRGSRVLPVLAERGVRHPLLTAVQHADATVDRSIARVQLRIALRRIDAAGPSWPDDRSPFPGLEPFDAELHRAFLGRGQEVEELATLLRSREERVAPTLLLVVGPSGCGKSSLVRAGLLPVMAAEPDWRTLPTVLPGPEPVAALARELTAAARDLHLGWTVADVRRRLVDVDDGLTGLADELLVATPGTPRRLLVVVDQFEEVLTRAAATELARFAAVLVRGLAGPVHVVATLRPEFLDQVLVSNELADLPKRVHALAPLRREALRTVVEGPARLAGIAVDEDLVARLVGDTDTGEALPLLAYTLAQLAAGVARGGELLPARYEQLGGVQGALTRQADLAVVDAVKATGRRPDEVIRGLLRLVAVEEDGHPTRVRVARDTLPDVVVDELDHFVERRLVTTDTVDGHTVVGVAHEAFLSAWAPLAQLIRDNAMALRAGRRVEQAAAEWIEDPRPARLWERGQLAANLTTLGVRRRRSTVQGAAVDLGPGAVAFLQASIRRDRFRRRRAVVVLSALLVLALVAAAVAVRQSRAALTQRDSAMSRQIAGQAHDLRATDPALAAQLGLTAYRFAPTPEARGSLLSTFATPYATQITAHLGPAFTVAFNPGGDLLATAGDDRTVRLWDVRAPHRPVCSAVLTDHHGAVFSVAFSPDGRTLATAGNDHTVRLWDVSAPDHPVVRRVLTDRTDDVRAVAFSHDGRFLATAGDATEPPDTVQLWDVTDPGRPVRAGALGGHTKTVRSVAFNPAGDVVAAGDDGTARLWSVGDPAHPVASAVISGPSGPTTLAAFDPADPGIVAVATADPGGAVVRIWDTRVPGGPGLLSALPVRPGTLRSLVFGPDGHTLAAAGSDLTIGLWDVADPHAPTPLRMLEGHTDTVFSLAFGPDGTTLASASFDRSVRLWDLAGPILAGHTNTVFGVAFGPDGRTVATASDDGTARLWDVHDPFRPVALSRLTHTDKVKAVAFSPDGLTLATAGNDRTARLWDVHDPLRPQQLGVLTGHTDDVNDVRFSPDGRLVATVSDDHTCRLWDVHDPRRPSPLATLAGHTNTVWSVDIRRDGRQLATAGADGTALLWDIGDPHRASLQGTIVGSSATVRSVTYSPNGRDVVTTGYDGDVRIWDVTDPHRPRVLAGLPGQTGTVYAAAFSPDGSVLATTSHDTTVRLWSVGDPAHPTLRAILSGHASVVFSVAFSPDGHELLTGSADTTARLWETTDEPMVDRICRDVPALTLEQWSDRVSDVPYLRPCSR